MQWIVKNTFYNDSKDWNEGYNKIVAVCPRFDLLTGQYMNSGAFAVPPAKDPERVLEAVREKMYALIEDERVKDSYLARIVKETKNRLLVEKIEEPILLARIAPGEELNLGQLEAMEGRIVIGPIPPKGSDNFMVVQMKEEALDLCVEMMNAFLQDMEEAAGETRKAFIGRVLRVNKQSVHYVPIK